VWLHRFDGLLAKCRTMTPPEIELSALAALLHSFYIGVKIFSSECCGVGWEPVPVGNFQILKVLKLLLISCFTPTKLSPIVV
jgi:hypothetical protein